MNILSQFLGTGFLGALIGAVIGILLKGALDRYQAKKTPKTDRRAQAYQDFVINILSLDSANSDIDDIDPKIHNFNNIKARLIVFGESEVVCEIAKFMERKHQDLSSDDAKRDFGEVIRAMRRSVATGSGDDVIANILALLSYSKQD